MYLSIIIPLTELRVGNLAHVGGVVVAIMASDLLFAQETGKPVPAEPIPLKPSDIEAINWQMGGDNALLAHIRSIHQLQNFYHVMTGEELAFDRDGILVEPSPEAGFGTN